jgi:hypothetical protein
MIAIVYRGLDRFPRQGWSHLIGLQIAINGIMRKMRMMVGMIGLRIVDLGAQEKLAVVNALRLHGIAGLWLKLGLHYTATI